MSNLLSVIGCSEQSIASSIDRGIGSPYPGFMRLTITFLAVLLFLAGLDLAAQTTSSGNRLPAYPGNLVKEQKITDLTQLWLKSDDELNLQRNEIYAAYGRAFVTKRYQDYFSALPWYKIRKDYSDNLLSPADRANAQILLALTEKPDRLLENLYSTSEFDFGRAGNVSARQFLQSLVFSDDKVTVIPTRENYYLGSQSVPFQIRGRWLQIKISYQTLFVCFDASNTPRMIDLLIVQDDK